MDSKRYCNECKKSFGAPALIIQREIDEPISEVATGITFSKTVYRASFQPTQVSIAKAGTGAHVKTEGAVDCVPFESEYDISKKKWDALVDTLYCDLYLNDWKHHFDDYTVLDGEEWKLTIKMKDRRKRTYSGSNGYPPYWDELMKLMKPFMKSRN